MGREILRHVVQYIGTELLVHVFEKCLKPVPNPSSRNQTGTNFLCLLSKILTNLTKISLVRD
jgi:hypothetical protein